MTYRQNFEGDSPRQLFKKRNDLNAILRIKYIKIACFSYGHNLNVVCRVVLHRRWESLPTKRRNVGWYMHQGFVRTFPRFRLRSCNNSLAERLLFQAWNFSLLKLHTQNTGTFGHEREVICCPSKVYDIIPYPVPNPPACPQIKFLFT